MPKKFIIESDNNTESDSDSDSDSVKYTCSLCPKYKELLESYGKELDKWESIAKELLSDYEARKNKYNKIIKKYNKLVE